MEYTISAAARILGANAVGAGDYAFSELSVDSRRLSFPDSTLFFAIETGTNDGHKYVNDAYRMGVRCLNDYIEKYERIIIFIYLLNLRLWRNLMFTAWRR